MTKEETRLAECQRREKHWKRWGPYLSERAWGTVREDYSPYGNAWDYLPHDHARSRAYRWNEDGLAGICDRRQLICFALSLWNECDPILKERLFGLTGNEGNRGEDVKEYYFYLDSTPTHSYMRYLYKYPQAPFPYSQLVDEHRHRGKDQPEFELLDTGVFDQDRYFDVFVEYAKGEVGDILVKINVFNRGPETARLRLLPAIWFRNTWGGDADRQDLRQVPGAIEPDHPSLGKRWLYYEGSPELLFTENETNFKRLFGVENRCACVKDGINDYIVDGVKEAVAAEPMGTKAAAPPDTSIRPNQIFAVSLPHTMLSRERAKHVVEIAQNHLLTPYGLRSLAPSDPRYRGRYTGDPGSRDAAYHQGTVWPWLMGPFITAYLKVYGNSQAARRQAEVWVSAVKDHVAGSGLGHVSEIFDGDPPHLPVGCIAQAWSVAELLRAAVEDVYGVRPDSRIWSGVAGVAL